MEEEKSLKNQAEDIVEAVDRDLQEIDNKSLVVREDVETRANALMDTIFKAVSDVDIEAAAARIKKLEADNPTATQEELAQKIIREKCQRTGAIGAVTSGAGLIPGIGTAAAVTLGVAADIGATFKLQAELVLELAALYNYPLSEDEKQRLVMTITGISAGTTALARRAGQQASLKLGEKLAEKSIVKAIPVVGVVASAGTNVLSTYIIGQRADAYFRLGPDAMGSWADSLRTISGVDERRLGRWMAETGKSTGAAIASGAGWVGGAGKAAGGMVVDRVGKVAGSVGSTISSGASVAGESAAEGAQTSNRWMGSFFSGAFRGIAKGVGFVVGVVTFVPRKIIGLFSRKKKAASEE